jgi:acetyltransferase-like isoleucine patch superfamily enzyme
MSGFMLKASGLKRNENANIRRLQNVYHEGRRRLFGPTLSGSISRVRISPTARLSNVHINTICGSVEIGDFVFFGYDVLLLTGTHDFRETGARRQLNSQSANRNIIIEAGAWIASRAVIIGPCRIGANAVIGSGCLIDFDVSADTVVRIRQEITKEPIRYSDSYRN